MIDKRIVVVYENLYNKYIENNTECRYNKIANIDNIKQVMESYYKDLIDPKYNSTYNFHQELEKLVNIYQFVIKDLEFFDIYILCDDIEYCLNIIKIFSTFSKHILDNHKNKKQIIKSRLRGRKTFPIYIFPNNIKRNLVDNKFAHSHLDIYKKTNQAFTTSGMTGDYMVITKKEELIKLLLHEMIHFYKLDGTIGKTNNYLDDLRESMPFTDDNSEEECIAELLSNIYNSIFVCIIKSLDKKLNRLEQTVLLDNIIRDEQKYSYYVIAKILHYFNINPINIFNNIGIQGGKKVELVSPINLYHIFKSIIYTDIDILLKNNQCNDIFDISNIVYRDIRDVDSKIIVTFINNVEECQKKIYFDGNLNISYILYDIDISNINKNDQRITSIFDIQNGGGEENYGKKNYYLKYLKYKSKYLNEKNLIKK